MSNRDQIKENFLKDIAEHTEINIQLDDGVFRHIKFSRKGSSVFHFNITTFPGHLTITGDMGSYTFSRMYDMFDFFVGDEFSNDDLRINPSYWSEKLESVCKISGVEEFNSEDAEVRILDYVGKIYHDEYDGDEDKEDLIEDIRSQIDFQDEIRMRDSFVYAVHSDDFLTEYINVNDYLMDINFRSHTYHYIWCCYAIVWGILKYKEIKK